MTGSSSLKIRTSVLSVLNRLISLYGVLPSGLRRALLPLSQSVYSGTRRATIILSQIRLPVLLFEGTEKNSGGKVIFLVLGKEKQLSYLHGLYFSEIRVKKKLGTVFIWNLRSYLSGLALQPDMAVVHVDAFYSRFLAGLGFVFLPEWVTFKFDLSNPLQETWRLSENKTLRENLRRVRKYKYTYDISSNPAHFETFYHRMYLPFIPRRYGEEASLISFRMMKVFFKSGVLLLVKQGREIVSGNIIMLARKSAKSIVIGLKDGNVNRLKKAALSASYYFTMLWAQKEGYQVLDFGECRPFLNEGLVYYKKRWGMVVESYKHRKNLFGIQVCRMTPPVRNIFARNPFIFTMKKQLNGLVISGSDRPLSDMDIRMLMKKYFISGLDRLTLVSEYGFNSEVLEKNETGAYRSVVLIEATADDFFRRFWPSIQKRKSTSQEGRTDRQTASQQPFTSEKTKRSTPES